MAKRHFHSPGSIDHLAYASGMNIWNPVFKTALSIGTMVICLLADTPLVSLTVILTFAAVQKIKGGLPLHDYIALLGVPLAFLIFGGLALAFDASRLPAGEINISLHWFYICATKESAAMALGVMLRALGAVSALYLLALTTTACELAEVLRLAHVPPLVCELMYLVYRFIFVLLDTHSRMRTAADARLGWRDFWTSCRSFGGAAGNLLVLSLRKSRAYYDAMAARGYESGLRFLEEEKPFYCKQALWTLAFWGMLFLIWFLGACP